MTSIFNAVPFPGWAGKQWSIVYGQCNRVWRGSRPLLVALCVPSSLLREHAHLPSPWPPMMRLRLVRVQNQSATEWLLTNAIFVITVACETKKREVECGSVWASNALRACRSAGLFGKAHRFGQRNKYVLLIDLRSPRPVAEVTPVRTRKRSRENCQWYWTLYGPYNP